MKANKHEINGYIYVTSEEEVTNNTNVKDKYYVSEYGFIVKAKEVNDTYLIHENGGSNYLHYYKECILCNNPNLPIQQLTEQEIEYLKSVDSFEVEKEIGSLRWSDSKNTFKIIIPQETEQPKESIDCHEPNQYLLEHYLNRFDAECFSGDEEIDHSNADELLCELLHELGYSKIVEKFSKVDKWYA